MDQHPAPNQAAPAKAPKPSAKRDARIKRDARKRRRDEDHEVIEHVEHAIEELERIVPDLEGEAARVVAEVIAELETAAEAEAEAEEPMDDDDDDDDDDREDSRGVKASRRRGDRRDDRRDGAPRLDAAYADALGTAKAVLGLTYEAGRRSTTEIKLDVIEAVEGADALAEIKALRADEQAGATALAYRRALNNHVTGHSKADALRDAIRGALPRRADGAGADPIAKMQAAAASRAAGPRKVS